MGGGSSDKYKGHHAGLGGVRLSPWCRRPTLGRMGQALVSCGRGLSADNVAGAGPGGVTAPELFADEWQTVF